MNALESKLPRVGTTIFTVMTRLAEKHGAVNLSQGFPDFQPPARLVELVARHLTAGRNQYAPMPGAVALREAIAGKLRGLYGVHADPEEEITITSGATEALFCAINAVVRPGDEVVVFDPAYDSYDPSITLAGGRTVHVPLAGQAFAIDWERVEDSLSDRTRLVIVNSPHNPSGAVLSSADLDRLAALLRPYGCYVLSDEVYEHIVFDGAKHATILAHAELAERSFAVFSFGKTYHATGWKTGYCVAPRALSAELRRVHQYVTFASVTPLQHALADYIVECPEHYLGLPEFYAAKRDRFIELLSGTRFRLAPSRGTYFQLADYGAISDEPDVEFARRLTVEHGVAVIPISVFYDEPIENARLVRFCFAKENATLDAAAKRLADV
ncbi:MAG TPA: pyridoxal phosphate-dependent aminotransferase [Gammaproteobacteria bacterium]|nr:pyridoxal phosphate-dependent aminotransferase [Gammaproteobacteria bacterium]